MKKSDFDTKTKLNRPLQLELVTVMEINALIRVHLQGSGLSIECPHMSPLSNFPSQGRLLSSLSLPSLRSLSRTNAPSSVGVGQSSGRPDRTGISANFPADLAVGRPAGRTYYARDQGDRRALIFYPIYSGPSDGIEHVLD